MASGAYIQQLLPWLDATLTALKHRKQDIPRIRSDVVDVVRQTGSLTVRVANRPQTTIPTIVLEGTVPIYFQGKQYNTPMNIFVVEGYPANPPQCFVTPTPGMIIKPSHKHVDSSGMCYLPYLHEWSTRSTLTELVAHMSSIFGQDPPLRTAPPPPPPAPPSHASMSSLSQPPPPQQQPYGGTVAYGSSMQTPYMQPQAQPQPQPYSMYGQQTTAYQPPPPPPPKPMEDPEVVAKRQLLQRLVPRLQRDIEELGRTIYSEMEQAALTSVQLQASEEKIKQGVAAMNQEKGQLAQNGLILQSKVQELTEWLQQNEKPEEEIDIDALTDPKEPLIRQLLHTTATDQAIADAMRVLDRALQRGAIDLPNFLRQIRFLSEEQFDKRALSQKLVQLTQTAPSMQPTGTSLPQPMHPQGYGMPPRPAMPVPM